MTGYFRPVYIHRSDVSVPAGSGRYKPAQIRVNWTQTLC